MPRRGPVVSVGTVRHYLVEIPVRETSEVELGRASRTLRAAESRLRRRPNAPRLVATAVAKDDGRLLCLVEAGGADEAQGLVALALLPEARIRELSLLDPPVEPGDAMECRSLGGRDPGCDLRPGAETQLVEDVAHVSLHGALRKE